MAQRADPGDRLDTVDVPVPRFLLPEIYALLADRLGAARGTSLPTEATCPYCRSTAYLNGDAHQCEKCGLAFRYQPGSAARAGVEVDADNGTWTPAMVHALAEAIVGTTAEQVLTHVASRSPATVGYEELIQVTGLSQEQLRAEMASLSKAARRVFGQKIWPMTARQGWGAGDRMGYRMPELVAEWWRDRPKSIRRQRSV